MYWEQKCNTKTNNKIKHNCKGMPQGMMSGQRLKKIIQ